MNLAMALAFGALGVVALAFLAGAFKAEGGFRGLTAGSVLAFSCVILSNLTTAVGVLTGSRTVTIDVNYNRITQYVGASQQVNQIASPLLMVVALIVVIAKLRSSTRINAAALWFCLFIFLGSMAAWGAGMGPFPGARVTLLAVLAATVVIDDGREILKGAAFGVGVLAGVSALAALISPELAAPLCDARKCGVLGTLYVGIADNQNAFGLMMAFAVPVLYLGLRKFGLRLAIFAAFMAFVSGGRTGQTAAALALLCVLWAHFDLKSGRRGGRRIAGLITVGAAAIAVAVPYMGLDPESLTGRPELWNMALDMMNQSWWIGHGPDLWRSLVGSNIIPLAAGYSTHNQFLEVLFVAGVLGTALFGVSLALVVRRSRHTLRIIGMLMLPVAVAAITERPWSLGAVDWATWTLLIFLSAGTAVLPSKDRAAALDLDGHEASEPVIEDRVPHTVGKHAVANAVKVDVRGSRV